MWNGQKKELDETSPSTHSQGDNSFSEKSHRGPEPLMSSTVCIELDEAFSSVTHEGCPSLTNFPYPSALSPFTSLSSQLPGLSELHD